MTEHRKLMWNCHSIDVYMRSLQNFIEAKNAFVAMAEWHPYTDQFRKAWPAV
jgi:hypothetical protein